jgi:hypothetical protein
MRSTAMKLNVINEDEKEASREACPDVTAD